MVKKILSYVREFKKETIMTPVCMIGEVLMEIFIPLVMAKIIDNGLKMGDLGYVIRIGLLMFVMAAISLAFGVASGFYGAKASAGLARNLRQGVFYKVQEFSFSNIDHFQTSSLITRMTTDITMVQNAFQMILRMGVRSPMMAIISFAMAWNISHDLSLIFLFVVPFLAIALGVIVAYTFPKFRIMFERYDTINRVIQENLSSIRVVKAYVREDHEIEKFGDSAKQLYNTSVAAEKMIALNQPIMMFAINTCILSMCWLASSRIVYGTLTTGQFMSLLSYIMSILSSLMMLSMFLVMITMSQAAAKRIVEVLDEVPDLANPEHPVTEVKDGSIEFDHVSFSYFKDKEKLHLQDATVSIKSGMTVGILGGTGSAKTTFVSLIPRLYDALEGTIRVGGVDVRDYNIASLRDSVSVVLQKNVLFSGTIATNLRWGNPEATDEDLKRVCRLACADEFISTFPDGYDTKIEQGGTNVSGGQKQRLCIARALLKKPKILILDDSTSAVDMKTDALIRKAFAEEIPDTTKLIIAQRISSVQDADMIIVMNEGQITDIGNHEELMKTSEVYREIYETQTKGGSMDE